MLVITESTYSAPPFLSNWHVQTIFPGLFRRVSGVSYQRERIRTVDGDFLDLDWAKVGSGRTAILSHGLEGSSDRSYILGMARALNRADWDVLAWNFRGCSGEPNATVAFYHRGATHDLHAVASHGMSQKDCTGIALVGFSLGGNLTLKYLGEKVYEVSSLIKKAVVFSVPCDLASGSIQMAMPFNRIYMIRFLRSLRRKIKAMMVVMPGIHDKGYGRIKTFKEFDDCYTAPLHGFKNAEEYWRKASSRQFIDNISVPTLLVSAKNDPFLAPPCYPIEEAKRNPQLFLEIPGSGGHVGFISFNHSGEYWSESRAVSFLED